MKTGTQTRPGLCLCFRHGLAQPLVHGLFHCPEDVLVAGTAAQVAGQELPQFRVGVLLAALQNLYRRQDETRCAEAALDGGYFNSISDLFSLL